MLRDFSRRYPLFFPLVFLLLGIGVACRGQAVISWELGLPFGILVLARRKPAFWLGLLLFCFFLGAWRFQGSLPPEPSGGLAAILGNRRPIDALWRVESYAECQSGTCRVRAKILGWWSEGQFHEQALGIQLKGKGEVFLIPGEVYRSSLLLRRPRGFHNPDSFDYPAYLRFEGMTATAWSEDLAAIRRQSEAGLLDRAASKLRRGIRECLQAAVPEGPSRGVLQALLLGDGSALNLNTEENFRRTGLTHVLVVSGLHFTFVLLFFYFPFYFLLGLHPRWAESGKARRVALGGALIPAFGYGLMVGLSPSVLRGLGACALLFLAVAGRRRGDFGSSLLLIGILLLLWNPLWCFSISFQLSFLSVASVYYFGKPFMGCLEKWQGGRPRGWNRVLRWVLATFYSSMVANLALLPLLGATFHEVSLIAPIANVLFVPFFATFLLPAELTAALAGFFRPSWGQFAFQGLAKILDFALSGLATLAGYEHATVLVPPWSLFSWAAYFAGMVALLGLRSRRVFLLATSSACLCLVGGWGWSALHPRPSRLSLTMIDVGQGESLLLRLPDGEALLLDGGGLPFSDFDMGRNVVLPELLGRDIRDLDAMILSHPDADHWKGLKSLAERLPVREFWIGEGTLEEEGFAKLHEVLQRRKIPLRILRQGEKWRQGGAEFTVLWPPLGAAARSLSDNDLSLVLRICFGEVCFYLTGDLESEGEAGILANLKQGNRRVLKVAHHGSATSSSEDFLEALEPDWALISVGEGNRYRLPNPQVLKRLRRSGGEILRTDLAGQITLETDGKELSVSRFIDAPFPSCWSAIRGAVYGSGS